MHSIIKKATTSDYACMEDACLGVMTSSLSEQEESTAQLNKAQLVACMALVARDQVVKAAQPVAQFAVIVSQRLAVLSTAKRE